MHPTDGELMATLDEPTDDQGQRQLQRHVDGCERCHHQMAQIARGRLVVGALLRELEAPVPARFVEPLVRRARQRRSRRRELIAAAAALFIATAAGATIRSGGLHDLVRRFTSPRSPVVVPARPAARHTDDAATGVALVPTNNVQVEFAAPQTEGDVRIILGAGPQVTVTSSAPVPYAVRSGNILIHNEGARASYQITLPRNLESAAIRVAGHVIFATGQSGIVTKATREGADSFRVALALPRSAR